MKEKFYKNLKAFWNDEEAQGMMEYILLAVAVVAIVSLVGPKITKMVGDKTDNLANEVSTFQVD